MKTIQQSTCTIYLHFASDCVKAFDVCLRQYELAFTCNYMQLNLFENFNSELKYQALNTNLIESTKVAQEKSNTKKWIN